MDSIERLERRLKTFAVSPKGQKLSKRAFPGSTKRRNKRSYAYKPNKSDILERRIEQPVSSYQYTPYEGPPPTEPTMWRQDLLMLVRHQSTEREAVRHFTGQGFGPEAIRYIFIAEGIHFPAYYANKA